MEPVHVGDWKFGTNVRIEEHIGDITKVPRRLTSVETQIVLRERYETAHSIYNHTDANDHFALVRHHWSEDTIVASRLRERMESFKELRIGKYFDISFPEFLKQPTYMCDLMIEVIKEAPEENKELHDLLNEMKNK